MADNVQPDAGEQREESSSGLLLSVDPLQDVVSYKLASTEDDDTVDDSDGDTDDGDGSDADNSDDSNDDVELVVAEGATDSDNGDDSDDTTDDSDGDASDDD